MFTCIRCGAPWPVLKVLTRDPMRSRAGFSFTLLAEFSPPPECGKLLGGGHQESRPGYREPSLTLGCLAFANLSDLGKGRSPRAALGSDSSNQAAPFPLLFLLT